MKIIQYKKNKAENIILRISKYNFVIIEDCYIKRSTLKMCRKPVKHFKTDRYRSKRDNPICFKTLVMFYSDAIT